MPWLSKALLTDIFYILILSMNMSMAFVVRSLFITPSSPAHVHDPQYYVCVPTNYDEFKHRCQKESADCCRNQEATGNCAGTIAQGVNVPKLPHCIGRRKSRTFYYSLLNLKYQPHENSAEFLF